MRHVGGRPHITRVRMLLIGIVVGCWLVLICGALLKLLSFSTANLIGWTTTAVLTTIGMVYQARRS